MSSERPARWISGDEVLSIVIAAAIVTLAASLLAIFFVARYKAIDVHEEWLFTTADQSPTLRPLGSYILGEGGHIFSDFVVPYEQVLKNPFNPGIPYAAPFLVFLRGLFSIGSYKFQLGVFMTTSVLGLAVPALWASRGLSVSKGISLVALFGILPFPILFGLDRGNTQSLMLPLLFLISLWIERQRWSRSAAMIVVATCMKFYPLILIIPLIINRKFKLAAIACVASGATILLAMTTFDAPLAQAVKDLIRITGGQAGSGTLDRPIDFFNFQFYNWSLAGALSRLGDITHVPTLVSLIRSNPQAPGIVLLAWIVGSLAFSWKLLPSWMRATMFLAPIQLCTAISYPYTMSWVLIPIAFAIRPPRETDERQAQFVMPRWLQAVLLSSLAVAVTVKPTWGGFGAIFDPQLLAWKNFGQLIDPLLLTGAVVVIGAWGLIIRFRHR
jgi:hypothetical protein